MLYKTFVLEI